IAIGKGAQATAIIRERWRLPLPSEAPALPFPYLARPDLLQPLHDFLSSSNHTIVALTGLEGVGKTTLSIDLAQGLQERFVDGVLWGECRGMQGEFNGMLGGFVDRLGGDSNQILGYNERVTILRSMLNNRRVLIVFDNLDDQHFNPRTL